MGKEEGPTDMDPYTEAGMIERDGSSPRCGGGEGSWGPGARRAYLLDAGD